MTAAKIRRRPSIEALESRQLLAATFEPFPVTPTPFVPPFFLQSADITSVTTGPDGNLWFTAPFTSTSHSTLGSINPTTHASTLYSLPSTIRGLSPIALGPDGNIYTVGIYGSDIPNSPISTELLAFNASTHALGQYVIGQGEIFVKDMTVGPDGNIWFLKPPSYIGSGSDAIDEFDVTTHIITEYPLVAGGTHLGITSAHGLLWFTESEANSINSFDPATHAIVSYPVSQQMHPNRIALGPDGNLWFSGTVAGHFDVPPPQIGKLDVITHVVTTFSAPAYFGVTAGPDGRVWFTGLTSIGEIDPATGVITNYASPSPLTQPNSTPDSILTHGSDMTLGPDGNLWATGRDQIIEVQVVPITASITGSVAFQPPGAAKGPLGPLVDQTVYVDLNNSGAYYLGEPTAITDALGRYTITGLAPGTYTVRTAPFPGTVATYPASIGRTITVAAGQDGTLAPLGALPTSTVLPLVVAPDPFGTLNPDVETAEVIGLYRTILGRAPDPAGQAAAVGSLKSGMDVARLAAGLLTSPEFYTDVAIADYKNILGRSPNADEFTAVVSALRGGYTPEALASDLYRSSEYQVFNFSDPDFVIKSYEDVLGRQASNEEVSGVAAQMAGGLSRAAVVTSLLTSNEARQVAVKAIYANFLARPAEAAGLVAGVAALGDGITLSRLAIGLAGSPEYARRANSAVA